MKGFSVCPFGGQGGEQQRATLLASSQTCRAAWRPPRRNAERLGNDIDSAQGALYRSHLKRVASHFFQLGVDNRYPSG